MIVRRGDREVRGEGRGEGGGRDGGLRALV